MRLLDRKKWDPEKALPTDIFVKAVDAEVTESEQERVLNFRISTETEDSYRDVIKSDGWDLERFLKNPVVLWAHDSRQPPVAKAIDVRVEDKALVASAEFADAETYAFADTVYRLLKGGFLRATSVGFFPKEWTFNEERGGFDFLEQELFEFSVVPVPANPDALSLAVKSGIDIQPLREWAEEILTEPVGDRDPSPVLRVLDVPSILKSLDDIEDDEPEEKEPIKLDVDDSIHTREVEDDDDDITAEEIERFEKFIDELPATVSTMQESLESLKAQIDQILVRIDEDEKEKATEEDGFDLSAVIDIQPIDTEKVDEVSRSIIDFELDPEELQACIRRQLEEEVMKTTGRLPKEV